ncbi:hypothetical protein [Streptomyces sp. NBC_01237]|uniref:hypothetical protein n=1 Tax=Streptomyces sp. NBC_01237 TaxID=2903790 RepID=UPI002DD8F19F|nr:hypothetical protein [Streptomyces sp. NBC_01237]WRZ72892.1 hypothetical protein OG251_15345 [Streptomyces sp. NBC_01237]
MTFPQTPLDVRIELMIGVVWTDITTDVYTRTPITITRGSADEASSSEPSTCSLTLNNRSGKYSPRNPLSPYYGLIGRNSPIRISVAGPESYLALDGTTTAYARTPDVAALDITGDIDIRVEATADWEAAGSQALIGKWISGTNQRSYLLRVTDGVLFLNWSTAGSASLFASAVLPALPRRAAVRATLDVDNGSSGFTATLYWATSMAGPWTVIGAPLTSTPATSIFAGSAPLEVAPIAATGVPPLSGRVHRAEVRSGIGGTIVASLDVRPLAPGTTGWTDSAGRLWALAGAAAVTNRQYRFTGEISAWPSRWDVSGADVWVPVEAAGITRRMSQGQKALDSTLRRRIPAFSPLAYWPCEDEDGSTQAYSPIDGVAPLTTTGWRFGQDDTLAGSGALPTVAAGGRMVGKVPVPAVTPTEWSVHMVYAVDGAPSTDGDFLSWRATGTVRRWRIIQSVGVARIQGYNSAGDLTVDQPVGIGADVYEGWQRLYFRLSATGGTVTWRLDWYNIGGAAGGIGGTYSGTTGAVTQIETDFSFFVTNLRVGHIAVLPAAVTAAYTGADHGFSGDTVLARMRRLANEEAKQVSLRWIDGDTAANSERLGPQRQDTLLNLLEEAAATDGGILYEDRDRLGLIYRDRASLYNQRIVLPLDYLAEGEVPPPLEPTEDDQQTRNDITITRSGGSSARAVLESGPLSVQPPPAGIGPYDTSETLSLYSDDQPQRIANWRMHLGTWDEARYPTISVWLHAAPHLIPAVLAMDIGDRLTISNPPAWVAPGLIDQHARGYTEVLDQHGWTITMNCVPAGPWTVGVVGDTVLGRADTDGTTLNGPMTATTTTANVVTGTGLNRWIDSAAFSAMFPFNITVGGEVMRVTSCFGTALSQTFTVVRSVNGITKPHASGTRVRLAAPMRAAL